MVFPKVRYQVSPKNFLCKRVIIGEYFLRIIAERGSEPMVDWNAESSFFTVHKFFRYKRFKGFFEYIFIFFFGYFEIRRNHGGHFHEFMIEERRTSFKRYTH